MYVILACLWLVAGVGLLVYQWLSGDQRLSLFVGDMPISTGWVMILFSGWNVARWWSRRVSLPARQTSTLLSQRHRIRRIKEPAERDPNFIFTDEPPPPPASQETPPEK
jgi:hypothetical protein